MYNKFKAIGFDWSGVVFFHAFKYIEAGSKFLNIPQDEFRTVFFKYNHLINVESIEPKEFWSKIFAEFDRESETNNFLDFLRNAPAGKFNQEILLLIQVLKNKGYKVGLLSNFSREGAREARSVGVDDIFDVSIFSAEVGYMKPYKEVFEILAKQLGVDLTQMIFIDDTPKSLEKANEIGYYPVLYKSMSELLEEFKKLAILSSDEINTLKK